VPDLTPLWRAFIIVTLTALNVTQVARGRYTRAFCTGSALSFVWWMNTQLASLSHSLEAHLLYTLGAGCGTVAGMWLGRKL
jgi:hypothetical protein